jgi:hypothetical protein
VTFETHRALLVALAPEIPEVGWRCPFCTELVSYRLIDCERDRIWVVHGPNPEHATMLSGRDSLALSTWLESIHRRNDDGDDH